MDMIDFTNLPHRNKTYAGANGSKISVVYQDALYMLKFPPTAPLNPNLSYSNSCISEYLGCHIFESVGIPVQETLLGTYTVNGKEKIVVACKDFTSPGIVLQDFGSLKNQVIDSARNGYGTELSDILYTFEHQMAIDPLVISRRFWDMFVVDALIGNWDRHNGNWGFLYNTQTDEVTLAPVYDCGSSLYPQADEQIMHLVLSNPHEMNRRIYEIPLSAIMLDGKKINYFNFISSLQNADCNLALERIVPRIHMDAIKVIIDQTPFIGDLQKRFYLTMLIERKQRILDHSLNLLQQPKRDLPLTTLKDLTSSAVKRAEEHNRQQSSSASRSQQSRSGK